MSPSPPDPGVAQTEESQRAHYDRIIAEYGAHYDDGSSQAYRNRFLYGPMFKGVSLRGQRVLEAMCGSGQTTRFLVDREAQVTGLDISEAAIQSFRKRWPGSEGVCGSIFDTGLAGESFDVVVVVGGLHHLHPHVHRAVDEIHRLLKPGGMFCFCEAHAGSLPDIVRRWWYRSDALFEESEAAIDLDTLKAGFADRFRFDLERYVGSVAYLLVLNSMVFRIPRWLKPLYAVPLCALEGLLSFLHTKRTACAVVGRWRKPSADPGASAAPEDSRS